MDIRTKESFATVMIFLIIGILATVTWDTYAKVEVVNRQRPQLIEIARGISELRMIAVDYLINREPPARKQWQAVSDRIDHLLAKNQFSGLVEAKILARLLDDRARTQAIFAALPPLPADNKLRSPDKKLSRQQEDQLLAQLVLHPPNSIAETFRLADQAIDPIIIGQQRMLLLVLAGLFLIALIKGREWWLINRKVLLPMDSMQQALQAAAASPGEATIKNPQVNTPQSFDDLPTQMQAVVAALEHEIAEREKANAALHANSRELARSNTALAQFASVASHDMQEPLRMVTRYLHLLERHLSGKVDGEAFELLYFAVDGAQRMQKMVDGILAYSGVTAGQMLGQVDSTVALQEAMTLLATQVTQTHAQVEVKLLPVITADYTQLVQLFQNLIGNALKYCRGTLPKVRIEAHRHADIWCFSVTDNGIGIALEDRVRIFGLFQRLHTQREYPGTGMGLAICQRIVECHGGEIGVEAAADGGSVFWFTIPVQGANV